MIIDAIIERAKDWPVGPLELLFALILVMFIIFIVFAVIDYVFGHDIEKRGVVAEKSHTPSSNGVGVGPSIGGSGGVAVVMTATRERYILFVSTPDGGFDGVEVERDVWIKTNKGDEFIYKVRVGRFFA